MDDMTAIKIPNDEVKSLRKGLLSNETLLDRFAAKAMQGELACQFEDWNYSDDWENLSKNSYDIAESMMKEREKRMGK